jgi:hypothetical protein
VSWIGFSGVVAVAVWLIHRAGRDLRRQITDSRRQRDDRRD